MADPETIDTPTNKPKKSKNMCIGPITNDAFQVSLAKTAPKAGLNLI